MTWWNFSAWFFTLNSRIHVRQHQLRANVRQNEISFVFFNENQNFHKLWTIFSTLVCSMKLSTNRNILKCVIVKNFDMCIVLSPEIQKQSHRCTDSILRSILLRVTFDFLQLQKRVLRVMRVFYWFNKLFYFLESRKIDYYCSGENVFIYFFTTSEIEYMNWSTCHHWIWFRTHWNL